MERLVAAHLVHRQANSPEASIRGLAASRRNSRRFGNSLPERFAFEQQTPPRSKPGRDLNAAKRCEAMEIGTERTPIIWARRDAEHDTRLCFACGSASLTTIDSIRDHHTSTGRQYALRVCQSCGSARLVEALTSEELEQIYPSTFYSYNVDLNRNRLSAFVERLRYNRHRFRPNFSKLLEIGSGCGEFLATIRDRGSVVGLERSSAARDRAKMLGVDVHVGDVTESGLFASGIFDYAYLSHSFEHLDEPAGALASLRLWLTPEGKLFVAVPNYAGLLPRFFKRSWYNLAVPLHVSQFTPRGMRALLERNGFIVDRIAFNSDPISIPMSVLFALGLTVTSLRRPAQAAVMILGVLLVPFSRLMDFTGMGDCMEVHAHRVQS